MDQDDPEQRIAELERQLADAKAAAGTDQSVEQPRVPRSTAEIAQRPPLTAADIKKVAFSRPPIGKRGYNEDEVDAFLDLVEELLLNPSTPSLTAVDVRNMAFSKPPIGKRGYNEDEVDAFLDLVESEISRLDGAPGDDTGQQYPPQPPPVGSHHIANVGSKRVRGLRSVGIGGWLTAIVAAGVWLYMFGALAWDAYGYQVGTPVTATNIECVGSAAGDANDPHAHCTGTWSIGGQSRKGPIHRAPGSWSSRESLDVRVHGGTAFAAGSTGWHLGLSILFFVGVITMSLGGFQAFGRRWRQWRSHRRQPL